MAVLGGPVPRHSARLVIGESRFCFPRIGRRRCCVAFVTRCRARWLVFGDDDAPDTFPVAGKPCEARQRCTGDWYIRTPTRLGDRTEATADCSTGATESDSERDLVSDHCCHDLWRLLARGIAGRGGFIICLFVICAVYVNECKAKTT